MYLAREARGAGGLDAVVSRSLSLSVPNDDFSVGSLRQLVSCASRTKIPRAWHLFERMPLHDLLSAS